MLRIAICDDEKEDLETVSTLTMNLLEDLNIEYQIEQFSSGNALLDSTISFDVLLLDIEMDELNGMDIARTIRTNDHIAKIIFITNSQDYLRIGYTVKADGYFMKPIDNNEFNFELSNILKNDIIDNKFIYDTRISQFKIYLNDILYIEFYNRKTILYKEGEQISTILTLKEWLCLLENYQFIQCHKAFIVNLKHVIEIKTNSITLSSSKEILLSRKYKNSFKNKYFTYIGERF